MQLLFGVNYVVSKIVVASFHPLVWASFRIIIAAIVMVGAALLTKRPSPRGKEFFLPLIAFSLLGIIINQTTFLVGLRYTTSTNSAILNTLIPVFTFLIVTLRGQEKLTLRRTFGFSAAFIGVLVLRRIENLSLSDQTVVGDLLTIVNCLSYGIFLSYSKKFLEKYDRLWATTWMFLYGSLGIGMIALPDWLQFHWPVLTPILLGCMVFGILGATLLTYFLNNWALAYTKASSVAIFIYLQPVVAAGLAWAWKGQAVTLREVASSILVFIGVLLVVSPDKAS